MAEVSFRGDVNTLLAAALDGKRNERELREAIRKAAELLEASRDISDEAFHEHLTQWRAARTAWLALPAVQSALMLEEADKA